MSNLERKATKSPSLLFAEKSQMLRWFHEREMKELKAMRKGFELMTKQKAQKGGKA